MDPLENEDKFIASINDFVVKCDDLVGSVTSVKDDYIIIRENVDDSYEIRVTNAEIAKDTELQEKLWKKLLDLDLVSISSTITPVNYAQKTLRLAVERVSPVGHFSHKIATFMNVPIELPVEHCYGAGRQFMSNFVKHLELKWETNVVTNLSPYYSITLKKRKKTYVDAIYQGTL